ncbi:hypothetical protein [Halobaculum limi]|uniref:hypothetical protein n=1 Tax=Halobaculum limi TaxID=3031916 RepID=UPI0024049554|nr:hypothetical protein [Halobaculum sp. YSMS11]
MTDTAETAADHEDDADTIADIDHEAPEGAADPNAVWERGRDDATDDTTGDETDR